MNTEDGLNLAKQKNFDLVEIAPKAKPPTCKVMDYGKWKFDLKKKEKIDKKKQVKIVIKEIQVRPRTDQYDLNIKIKKARDFLLSGNKVKLHLRFSGRELAHKEIGLDVIEQFASKLKDLILEETDKPKMERRSVYSLFSPDPVKLKEFEKKKPSQPPVSKDKSVDSK